MTAIGTNKTWIKFLVVLFLVVIGIAGIFYAYTTYFATPAVDERLEKNVPPDAEMQ